MSICTDALWENQVFETLCHIVDFDCAPFCNLNKRGMDCAIRDFCKKIADGDCVLIYFSGHGMEEKVSIWIRSGMPD